MDDYATKPIEGRVLREALAKVTGPGLDLSGLLQAVGDDPDLLREVSRAFRRTGAEDLERAEAALAAGDAAELNRRAHRLAGSVAEFRALPAMQALREVERLAREGDLTSAAPALVLAGDRVRLLFQALEAEEVAR